MVKIDLSKMSLVQSMLMIVGILAVYGTYKVLQFVYLLIIGATANVATSGDITVPGVIFDVGNGSIGNETGVIVDVLNSVETGFAAFGSAELIVLGLIALVVIITIFWPMIAPFIPGNKDDKGGLN